MVKLFQPQIGRFHQTILKNNLDTLMMSERLFKKLSNDEKPNS